MPIVARIPVFRQRAPAFLPRALLPMPLMQPTDIYLPCFSHHFITQGVREVFDQRVQDPTAANLGNMMAGMMSTLFGQPQQRGPPVSERQSQQPGGTPQRSANDNSSRAQTNTTATQQGSISANPFAALFSQLLGGAGPVPAAHTGSGVGLGSHPGEGISQQASQTVYGAPSGQTLATFLQSLGENHSIVPGEGLLTDAFLCVAQHLTFSDLFNLFLGQTQPLSGLRSPLARFLRQDVLQGAQPSQANMRVAANRLVDEMMPDIQASLTGVEVRRDVDLEGTLRKFLSHHLTACFTFIMDASVGDEQFGGQFYRDIRRILGEFVVLTPACLCDGEAAFNTMLRNRLTTIMTGLSPMLRHGMMTMTLQYVTNFRQSLGISEADVRHYLVRPTTSSTASSRPSCPNSARASAPTTQSKPAPLASNAESPMEVDVPSEPPLTSRSHADSTVQVPQSLDLPRQGERREARTRPQRLSPESLVVNGNHNSSTPSPSASATSPREDNWQEVVPAEWVPVIEADVQRQKTQRPPAPLSDAYLQGLPPKRRRLMTYDQPCGMSNMSSYLPDALKQAAGQAGVEPISSQENLAREAAHEEEIHGLLEAEVQRSLTDRLEGDDDYSADRFPNAQQYFNTKPKPS